MADLTSMKRKRLVKHAEQLQAEVWHLRSRLDLYMGYARGGVDVALRLLEEDEATGEVPAAGEDEPSLKESSPQTNPGSPAAGGPPSASCGGAADGGNPPPPSAASCSDLVPAEVAA